MTRSIRGIAAGEDEARPGVRTGPRIVFLHGVMPRSGTNYLQSLLELHPDVAVNPYGIRELPLLNTIEDARAYEGRFLRYYRRNRESIHDLEMFACMVGGFLRRIEAGFPAGKTVVVKSPHTRMMRYFPYLFPTERCLIVLRDGRRAVQSTIDTWPLRFLGRTFADVCREWSYGTAAALEAQSRMSPDVCRLVRFEDAVADPDGAARDLLSFLGLEDSRYPFERIADLPILGSSRASRRNGEVSWTPVKKPEGFDPSKRPLDWSRKRRTVFDAVAGDMQKKAGYA
ncbi:sulfotransferase [Azospirillum sp. TSO35-2]|uniref:sulfotransferase family protein n=1 Tax=Azospirillum sp. TSO35-2 TaxID=716796 RepID=UPI001FFE7205|nr:sulfotransferase [Azospirillum sp. TSO35-2]